MTEPKDFYPWPRSKNLYLSHGELLTLVSSPDGRDCLQKEITTGIKQFLRDHPQYRSKIPATRDELIKEADHDWNAQSLVDIHDFLRSCPPALNMTQEGGNISVYFEALRQALHELNQEDEIQK